MFDRRVRIFLLLILLMTAVLLLRAAQVQVVQRGTWMLEAEKIMTTGELTETTRGRLLDFRNQVLAEDAPCIDACVDYRAITDPPDPDWIKTVAASRLRTRLGIGAYQGLGKLGREDRIAQESPSVVADIQSMWQKLAELGHMSADEMEGLRRSIQRKVEVRQRIAWYNKYKKELDRKESSEPPWYGAWLLDESKDTLNLDKFEIIVGEQVQPHVIIPAIPNWVDNELGKNLEKYPGLSLRPSVHRIYPHNESAAHVIGHLSRVSGDDVRRVEKDPDFEDELFGYLPTDLIGRSGLEALCEKLLRGRRGKIERVVTDSREEQKQVDALAGGDVQITIDIDLQSDIERAFENIPFKASNLLPWTDPLKMLGAAVVIDVPTNQIRAMVSSPTYNLNELDEKFAELVKDTINRPLTNRATLFALEPGSTVKPMVGIAAITQGIFGINDTIECIGYLQLGGRIYRTLGRCWVATMYAGQFGAEGVKHHPFPHPHETGFLTFSDALERSCNIFFETLGDRLGVAGLRYWYDQFGLGRRTGIGIAESRGRIPGDRIIPTSSSKAASWFAAIGQDQLLATPLQMANVAATIARNGIWMKPQLLVDSSRLGPTSQPDRVDLELSQEALRAARQGMVKVTNGESGTGTVLMRKDITIAGKTGSAQAAPLTVPLFDALGQPVYKPYPVQDKDGTVRIVQVQEKETLVMGTHENPNPKAPWYRGSGDNQDKRSHAWYIGFAPAEDPKIAFAVMVEYGGGGGSTAGAVAKKIIDACIEHGYLQKR